MKSIAYIGTVGAAVSIAAAMAQTNTRYDRAEHIRHLLANNEKALAAVDIIATSCGSTRDEVLNRLATQIHDIERREKTVIDDPGQYFLDIVARAEQRQRVVEHWDNIRQKLGDAIRVAGPVLVNINKVISEIPRPSVTYVSNRPYGRSFGPGTLAKPRGQSSAARRRRSVRSRHRGK